jgi:hypothetical protein
MNSGYHTTLQFLLDVKIVMLYSITRYTFWHAYTVVRMLVADSIFLCVGFLTFKRELYRFFPNPG